MVSICAMKFILFSIVPAQDGSRAKHMPKVREASEKIANILRPIEAAEMLSETVFLLKTSQVPHQLSTAMRVAVESQLAFRLLLVEEGIDVVIPCASPTPTQ